MDINNIFLKPAQIAELYTTHLLSTKEDEPQTENLPEKLLSFKGKNQKRFLWLVQEPAHAYLSDADFRFLTQVVEACTMSWDDIALFNTTDKKITFQSICKQLNPSIIVSAGVPDDFFPFEINLYNIEQKTGYQFFASEQLNSIRTDPVKKSKLWLGLKQLIQI